MASRTASCPPSILREKKKKNNNRAFFSSPHAATEFLAVRPSSYGSNPSVEIIQFSGLFDGHKMAFDRGYQFEKNDRNSGCENVDIIFLWFVTVRFFFSSPLQRVTKCIEICFIFTGSIFIDERWVLTIQRKFFVYFLSTMINEIFFFCIFLNGNLFFTVIYFTNYNFFQNFFKDFFFFSIQPFG